MQLIEPSDLSTLFLRLTRADVASLDDDQGVTNRQVDAIARAVHNIPADDIRRETIACLDAFDVDGQRIIAALICRIFSDNKSVEGLAMLLEVARARLPKTLFSLYLNVRYEPKMRSEFLEAFDDAMFDTIIYYIDQGDRWSIELLEACSVDKVIRNHIRAEAEKSSGLRRHVLDYCATSDPSALFTALEVWFTQGGTAEEWTLLQAIDFSDLNWCGRHDLFIAMLKLQNLELARLMLGGTLPPDITGLDSINMGDVEPWLNWMIGLAKIDDASISDNAQWVTSQLAVLLAQSSAPDNKVQLLKVLSEGTSAQQLVVAKMILCYMEELSIGDFSSPVLTFLKDLVLLGHGGNEFRPHLFSRIANEAFLREELIPLAGQSREARDAVATIVREAGKRLGIRLALPEINQDG